MIGKRSLLSRLQRAEHAAAASRRDLNSPAVWTDRFLEASAGHAELLGRIQSREEARGRTNLSVRAGPGRANAFDFLRPLLLDLPHWFPADDRPPWPAPADVAVVEDLANALLAAAAEYQLATGDWYPCEECCFRDAARRLRQTRRLAKDHPS